MEYIWYYDLFLYLDNQSCNRDCEMNQFHLTVSEFSVSENNQAYSILHIWIPILHNCRTSEKAE